MYNCKAFSSFFLVSQVSNAPDLLAYRKMEKEQGEGIRTCSFSLCGFYLIVLIAFVE